MHLDRGSPDRRERPELTDAELAAEVRAWLHTRPGAEHGDATSISSSRSSTMLRPRSCCVTPRTCGRGFARGRDLLAALDDLPG